MREQKITELVRGAVTAQAKPDFADLLRRIEADGGQSTAPRMTVSRSGVGRAAAYTAAGLAVTAALGTMAFIGLAMDSAKSSESFAADAEYEAPAASESIYEDNTCFESDLDFAAPMEPTVSEEPEDQAPVSGSDVSGSDVSDADAAGADGGDGVE